MSFYVVLFLFLDEDSQKDIPVISLPIIDSVRPRPSHLPLSFPEDLASRLLHAHGNPPGWWVGQFLRYLTRPQPSLAKELDDMLKKHKFKHPIVGYAILL